MSTLRVNTIQTNTTSGIDVNSPLETVPSLDVTGNVTVGSNISVSGIVTAGTFSGNLTGSVNLTTGITTVSAGSTASPSISPSGDNNTGIFFPSPDTIAFGEGGVEGFRLDSSGNVSIANGNLVFSTSGKGIDFSATANSSGTMTSELLSDYEEGTFTITISGSVSGSGNVSGTGRYTKIGRLCYVFYRIDSQNFPTFSGQMRISLPFTAGGTANEVQLGSKIYFFPLANWDGVANCAGFIIQALPNSALAVFTIEIVDSDRQNYLTNSNSSLSNSSGNYFSASLVYEVA
jgi:hypothetical protein